MAYSEVLNLRTGLVNAISHMFPRDHPRFFDQAGHQTTNSSIGNKNFFTKQ